MRSHIGTRLSSALAMLVLATALGCGGSSGYPTSSGNNTGGTGGTGTGGSTSSSISVVDNSFDPAATTVTAGTTVTWTWNGSAQHNVTFDDGSGLKSATQNSGTYSRTFASAGTYSYHCTIHGAGMSGTITVK